MRYIETYEDFKEKEVKESITPHIIEEWEFREDRSVEQVELIKLLKNKISCELIDISFSKDEKPCYYIDKKILRINVEEEQQWEWDEFVKLYKDIRYLVIRNANRISSKIFQISNLVYLELYCCDLTELSYEGISNLKNIETLSLEGSMVNKIDKHIFTLENLKNFSVMHTSIKEIPEDLCSLKKLRYIGLNGTKIKEVPKAIAKIEGLTDLYLGQTDICEFPIEMKNLKKLERLALWETQLEELPDWICEYKYLRGLYLGRTKKLCCLPERIGELINLEQLYLDGTQLNYLPKSFGNLINLKDLSLKGTKIRKFPPLREMKHLITCDLSNMILERIPGEFLESDMEIQPEMDFPNNGLILANTKLLCQPISLFSHEKAFIKTYYEEKKIHLNETKIVFLGDGEAGKSHIIERIKKDNHLLKTFKEESTPGIAISQKLCDVDGELIRLQIWDFGGQEIMHSMHRFF